MWRSESVDTRNPGSEISYRLSKSNAKSRGDAEAPEPTMTRIVCVCVRI